MKCPYCNQIHPDNYLICPITGRKIEQNEKKTCCNPNCDMYGKQILSSGALYCPYCGKSLEVNDYDEAPNKHRDFWGSFFVVDDLFEIENRGIVVTGFLLSGKITVGDEIVIVHREIDEVSKTVVLGIEADRKLFDSAMPGSYYGFLLRNLWSTRNIGIGDIVYKRLR